MPIQSFNSGRSFMAAGGLSAVFGPLTGGNPLAGIALKLIASRFAEEPRINIQAGIPVSLVEIKNTAMDAWTLGQTRSAYSDTWSRRNSIARPMRYASGG